MKVGAVAQIGENMVFFGEWRLTGPGHALAAHLREGAGVAIWHPGRHVVATNAGHGAAAFWHAGRSVVRAAAAKPGRALASGRSLGGLHGGFTRIQHRNALLHARLNVLGHTQLVQALGNGAGNQRRRQVGRGPQQPVTAGVGQRPFATMVITELAHHVGAHIIAPVVELFLDLILDDLALFLDHHDFLQALGKVARNRGLQRPDHVDLVHAYAQLAASGFVQTQIDQRLAHVVIGLAAGNQAKTILRARDDVVVQPVGAHIGQGRVPLVIHQPRFLLQRRIGPANVQTTGRHDKVFGQNDVDAVRADINAGRRFHHLLNRLQARPQAGKAAHGKGVQAHIQNVLHAAGKEHRRAAGLENVIALVRGGGAFADVIVTGNGNHTAMFGCARHVGVLENI